MTTATVTLPIPMAPISVSSTISTRINPRFREYCETIGRLDLLGFLSPKTPFAYWSAEFYGLLIKGGGGLGMLASDTLSDAGEIGFPLVAITPFYPIVTQQIIDQFQQKISEVRVTPEQCCFRKAGDVSIYTRTFDGNRIVPSQLGVYVKRWGDATLITITEPNLNQLYTGPNDGWHRLYQEIALGFGGYKALKLLELTPTVHQLNESATVFGALAWLDDLVCSGMSLAVALNYVRNHTLFTNHTLVPAAHARFDHEKIYRSILPNITSREVQNWLTDTFQYRNKGLGLCDLSLELSNDKPNGVSRVHAQCCSATYKTINNQPVTFVPVTNGVSIWRWVDPQFGRVFHEEEILDKFNLPTPNFTDPLLDLDVPRLEAIKQRARETLRASLHGRKDQYGNSITVPPDTLIGYWARRWASYKRPEMLFSQPWVLAELLEEHNIHLLLAGRAHPSDAPMAAKITQVLQIVHNNHRLRERVHFVADYDEPIAKDFARGGDIWINTPIPGFEACGTSGDKAILNFTLAISTVDGGMADPEIQAQSEDRLDTYQHSFLAITGDSPEKELASLYAQLTRAAQILNGPEKWPFLTQQLAAFLPIISGTRMISDYLNLLFPCS